CGEPVADEALGRLAAGALPRLRHAALPQEPLRRLEVAAGLLERPLAVHHPRAGLVAELLDEARRDRGHSGASSSAAGGASATGSSATGSSATGSSATGSSPRLTCS